MESIFENIKNDPIFFVLSTIILFSALGVVLEKNIIRAGFSLVLTFAGIAGIYFFLQAPFVGASQILIYAVGITLIIVFGLMLTSLKHEMPKVQGELGKNILSAIISVGTFLALSFALIGNKWTVSYMPPVCPKNTEAIGLGMLSSYALPFELVSVLLLVALIGGLVIAKKDIVKRKEHTK